MMSAIANKGTLYRPRLILGIRLPDQPGDRLFPVQVTGRLRCPAPAFETLSQGLYNVVMSDRGTGRKARVPGITMAGKTGTAEFGPESLKKKRGWMIAYAPFESPRFVVSVVVDEAEGGGIDAAPRVRRIMAGLFGVELPDEEGERG
jgi:penicillin-binding protein 2